MTNQPTASLPPELLEQLRDIHLPPEPHWFPPAPGWWILMVLVLALITCGILQFLRHRKYSAPKRALKQELSFIRSQWLVSSDSQKTITACSALLRRYAIARYGKYAAGLIGNEYLQLLDPSGVQLSRGAARHFVEQRWQAQPEVDIEKLLQDLEFWAASQSTKPLKPVADGLPNKAVKHA